MNQKIISIGAIVIAVVALLLSTFVLLSAPAKVETLGVTNFDAITLSGDLNAANVAATAGVSGANITATAGLSAVTLTVNSVQQSGAVKFGVAASAANNDSIAHGFATTPTVVLVSGSAGLTASVGTITATRFTVRTPGTETIYWLAGP